MVLNIEFRLPKKQPWLIIPLSHLVILITKRNLYNYRSGTVIRIAETEIEALTMRQQHSISLISDKLWLISSCTYRPDSTYPNHPTVSYIYEEYDYIRTYWDIIHQCAMCNRNPQTVLNTMY
jgi:hypothetical protein